MTKTVSPNAPTRLFTMKRLHLALIVSPSAGFTLFELLIALVLTSIVLALAGHGVVAMMQAENRIDSEITRRTNLNRSLEFMADEIRMAKSIARPASTAVPTPACGTATGVLNLTMPDDSSVLYYVHDLSTCGSTVWLKPAVIRRVTSGSDTVLVDALSTPATLPTCATSRVGASGFYACIENNRTANLFLYGALANSSGSTNGTYLTSSQVTARSF